MATGLGVILLIVLFVPLVAYIHVVNPLHKEKGWRPKDIYDYTGATILTLFWAFCAWVTAPHVLGPGW